RMGLKSNSHFLRAGLPFARPSGQAAKGTLTVGRVVPTYADHFLDGKHMKSFNSRTVFRFSIAMLIGVMMLSSVGCSTAPKAEDRASFISESQVATQWFKTRVPGLNQQIANSAGYIIYPSVGQWGIIYTGGKFGRGLVCKPDGTQIGWGAVNTGSLGLQVGVQGFKMLVIFENDATLEKFKANQLTGSVSGIAVVADVGGSGTAKFENGVCVYQGANAGLMAGVNMALDYMRYKPLGDDQ
ncbi:MAG TPA: hypothetical protein VFN20_15445, partial [Candidatus Acidoferrum sp.]|nr:hypothetical protein [Candidatus Acidoferrum sp.]